MTPAAGSAWRQWQQVVPVICLDLGGPAVQVAADTGFKIPAQSPDQVVQEMAKAMVHLAQDPELLAQMAWAGRQRIRNHFAWTAKGKAMVQVYETLVEKRLEAIV